MALIDIFGKLFKTFVHDESASWVKNFYKHVLPKIQQEYNLIQNEDGSQFAEYIKDMKESVQLNNVDVDSYLPRVFAIVKKAMGLKLKMEHFDVQLLGATVLHAGKIAEMKTGEGKTYITPLAAVLNCLKGDKVLIITSNEYLAQRDAELLKPIYDLLGLTVGYITDNMSSQDKKLNYQADIIHISNSTVVFDYLRDRLVLNKEDKLQPPYSFAIVDEVDSCLIDGARTPLIISGKSTEKTADLYNNISHIIKEIEPSHYTIISEKAILNNDGLSFIETKLAQIGIDKNIYSKENIGIFNVISNLLHAHIILKKGKDYIVTHNNKVSLIDQSTHRTADGRRFSHGLHQAIEALEGVKINDDNVISASTTYFTYATLFKKIGGMSGTCTQERNEFLDLYNLKIIQIPTNRPLIRKDHEYIWLFRDKSTMHQHVVDIIKTKDNNRPILICTPSVYESEILHEVLSNNNINHKLLNAKYPEDEVFIIEKAGSPGAVTLTTGMAGRGTDILLGESANAAVRDAKNKYMDEFTEDMESNIRAQVFKQKQDVIAAGGLLVLVVGLFESQKTEDQIRGRAGRQGEPGETMVLCSKDDDLIKMALPQEADGVVSAVANYINFVEDKDVLCDAEVTSMAREIQSVYQLNSAEVRKNQAKLSNNAQSISIPGHAGNYHYRDLILDCSDKKQFHFNLIHKLISFKTFDTTDLLIEYLGNKVFKDYDNPFITCSDMNDIYKTIQERLDVVYNEPSNQQIILYTYDKCYDKFMLLEDGARRTVNTIVYGHMDPATEYERIIFNLLKKTMHQFTKQALFNAFYIPNMSQYGSCGTESCPITPDTNLDDLLAQFMNNTEEDDGNDNNNNNDNLTHTITYGEYLRTNTNITEIYNYFVELFFIIMKNNTIEEIKSYINKFISSEMHIDLEPSNEFYNMNTIEDLKNFMLMRMNIFIKSYEHYEDNILSIIFVNFMHDYDISLPNIVINSSGNINTFNQFKSITEENLDKLNTFITNLIVLLFLFDMEV